MKRFMIMLSLCLVATAGVADTISLSCSGKAFGIMAVNLKIPHGSRLNLRLTVTEDGVLNPLIYKGAAPFMGNDQEERFDARADLQDGRKIYTQINRSSGDIFIVDLNDLPGYVYFAGNCSANKF